MAAAHAEDPANLNVNAQRRFHFDYAGWHALNLFVYLAEVREVSGAHQVVAGTHYAHRMRDAIQPWIPDDEIMARYAGQVRTITGPARTMFFEDTAAFQRRLAVRR